MVLLFATILHIRAIPGDIAGVVYATDIRTTLFGAPVTAYNIGGRTVICAEAMADFGYDVVWGGAARTLSITKPADFYRYDTDFGIIRAKYESGVNRRWRVFFLGDISVPNADGERQMLEIPSERTYILPNGVRYMKLSDLAQTLGGTCEMTEENGQYIFRLNREPETLPALRAYDPERDQGRREQTDTDEKDVYLKNAAFYVNGTVCPIRAMMAGKMRDTELLLIENHVYIPVDTVMWLIGRMPDYLRTKY